MEWPLFVVITFFYCVCNAWIMLYSQYIFRDLVYFVQSSSFVSRLSLSCSILSFLFCDVKCLLCACFICNNPVSIWLFHHFGLLIFLRGRLLQTLIHNSTALLRMLYMLSPRLIYIGYVLYYFLQRRRRRINQIRSNR